ncbi:hypothetical protein CANCADRAFT_134402 [Tortispora caseinolytica NRRL Y-17796]|uniref:Ribonuclease P/MRP protein subunit POP5 n=1 Tax=Tortispora caseinolytica NRRL Y-17796 TaxID=767744 RepID=A0A1E4TBN7_9ASCO|nr:hypothetical protein CANCADRAFT_134402 [Tortispora caseinolytica NRRL Y-17796]
MVRIKCRYIAFELIDPAHIDEENYSVAIRTPEHRYTSQAIASAIRESVHEHFGDYGAALVNSFFNLKYYSPTTGIGILRIGRDQLRIAQAALTYMNELDSRPTLINCFHVSGTIKHAQMAVHRRSSELVRKCR